jgi:hypothetical protein
MTVTTEISGAHDFDFFFGSWRVRHRRLAKRLGDCSEWVDFEGTCQTAPLLDGLGNLDDNFLDLPGDPYRALTLRSFDPATGKWAIWWLDGRTPHQLDVPMTGEFKNGLGTFYAHDTFDGKPIKVRFLWSRITPLSCHWEQAFSPDEGATWETNWIMDFERAA